MKGDKRRANGKIREERKGWKRGAEKREERRKVRGSKKKVRKGGRENNLFFGR